MPSKASSSSISLHIYGFRYNNQKLGAYSEPEHFNEKLKITPPLKRMITYYGQLIS